jgi:hypothetical protein
LRRDQRHPKIGLKIDHDALRSDRFFLQEAVIQPRVVSLGALADGIPDDEKGCGSGNDADDFRLSHNQGEDAPGLSS